MYYSICIRIGRRAWRCWLSTYYIRTSGIAAIILPWHLECIISTSMCFSEAELAGILIRGAYWIEKEPSNW